MAYEACMRTVLRRHGFTGDASDAIRADEANLFDPTNQSAKPKGAKCPGRKLKPRPTAETVDPNAKCFVLTSGAPPASKGKLRYLDRYKRKDHPGYIAAWLVVMGDKVFSIFRELTPLPEWVIKARASLRDRIKRNIMQQKNRNRKRPSIVVPTKKAPKRRICNDPVVSSDESEWEVIAESSPQAAVASSRPELNLEDIISLNTNTLPHDGMFDDIMQSLQGAECQQQIGIPVLLTPRHCAVPKEPIRFTQQSQPPTVKLFRPPGQPNVTYGTVAGMLYRFENCGGEVVKN